MIKKCWRRIVSPVFCALMLMTGPGSVMASDFAVPEVSEGFGDAAAERTENTGEDRAAEGDVSGKYPVPLTAGYFPDENFRKWVSKNADTDKDGVLSQKEALAVTRMDITGKGITDAKGIEVFANLKSLICIGAKLGTLDLTKNKNLTYVQVCSCGLTSLKVKGLAKLTELDYRFNSISGVSTAGCSALQQKRYAPQSSYTADVSATHEIGFSKLRNFHEQLAKGDVIKNLKGLEYGNRKDSFVVKTFGRTSGKGSFSICDKKGRLLGTCTIYADSVLSEKPSPAIPELVKVISGTGVTVYWKKVENVTGYRIYRKRKDAQNAKWETVAKVNSTYDRYKDTKGLLNEEYLYTVKAYAYYDGKNYYSKYDVKELSGMASIGAPVISSARGGAAPKFTWNAVSGADGYRIYRKKNGASAWKEMANVNSSQNSFTDKKAVPGTGYVYAIRAYRKVGSAYSLAAEYAETKLLKCTEAKK